MAVCVAYVVVGFMANLDATIVNPALMEIGRSLEVAPAATSMVEVGYLIGYAMALPVAGWLGDRWGVRRVFLAGLAIFTATSGLCALATDIAQLSALRVAQGAAAGLLIPVGMALLMRTFPPHERLRVSRMLVLPSALAPALGPPIGGLLVDHLGWRSIFLVNLPIGVAALAYIALRLPERREAEPGAFDVPGFLLAVPGLGALMFALGEGPLRGWDAPVVLVPLAVGAALLVALVVVELRAPSPLLDLRLLGDRTLAAASLMAVLATGGLFGGLYLFPLMYQDVLGASALGAGTTVFPEALGLMVAAQVVVPVYRWVGPRRLIALGLILTAAVLVVLARIDHGTDPWLLRGLFFLLGIFLGHAMLSLQALAFVAIPGAAMGRASALFTAQRQVGGAMGVALGAAVLAAGSGIGGADVGAYRAALIACAVLLVAAAPAAALIRGRDVRATLAPPPPAAVAAE